MGLFDKFTNKPDLDEIRMLTLQGLEPIISKWMESFDSVYSDEFEQFITSDTIIGHFVGFTEIICNLINLKDFNTFTGVIQSALGGILLPHFTNPYDLINLLSNPLEQFLHKYSEKDVFNGRFTATFYLKKVENPGPQYYQSMIGKIPMEQNYFFMIENAAIDFMDNY